MYMVVLLLKLRVKIEISFVLILDWLNNNINLFKVVIKLRNSKEVFNYIN